eukprot:GFUD01033831.1.p1 GENE.GFUD01033831.1~~GFUD01033831.1.p1  ORF type:complete len:217 (-),score=54.11 GFUD01033831.1:61-711(-)
MSFHGDNWDGYLTAFREHFQMFSSTDPDRFPTDARTGEGYWLPCTVPNVSAQFSCHLHGEQGGEWSSSEGQVDLQFRYNFGEKRGEVQIVREMRQRCPRLWLEMSRHPWQYPRLGQGELWWVMRKLASRIQWGFYGEDTGYKDTGYKDTGYKGGKREESLKHAVEDCEACQLSRCPWVRNMPHSNKKRGRDGYDIFNLERVEWVLLDENDHAFYVT